MEEVEGQGRGCLPRSRHHEGSDALLPDMLLSGALLSDALVAETLKAEGMLWVDPCGMPGR